MCRRLLVLLILVLASGVLFAQTTEEEWYLDKPIKNIEFNGLETVKQSTLEPIVRPYIGKAFTLELFWEIQGKLYALDYFQSIEGNAEPGDDTRTSVVVRFNVKERPTVSEIVLEGNRSVRRTDILDTIKVKQGDMVGEAQVTTEAEAIRDLYLKKGYLDAGVTGTLEPVKDKNEVRVVFRITEGVQTSIRRIRFVGNEFASEGTLRRVMQTKEQSLFNKGLFEESKLEEDIQKIQSYYGEKGYIDAKVVRVEREVQPSPEDGRNYLNLTLYIQEGRQYRYGGMSFEGNQIFTGKTLGDLVRQSPGSILNSSRLESDFQRITDLYYENGYIFNVITRQEVRDEEAGTVRYVVHIEEKDRAHIENIIVRGNTKTKDNVIYRELPFEVGDIFNKTEIIQGLRNLYNLQYFNSITPETPQGSAEGLMDLVINVEEGSTANINFGVMFSGGDYPISGMVKWQERNFLGRGQGLGVDLEFSNLRQLASFNFSEPWMFGKPWLGGASLSVEHAIVPNVPQSLWNPGFNGDESFAFPDGYNSFAEYQAALQAGEAIPDQYLMDYSTWKISAGINSGYRHLGPLGWLGVRGGLSTGIEYLTYDDMLYRPFDPTVRAGLNHWGLVNKLNATFYWDKRDYFLNPTEGFYLGQGVTFAGGFLFGERHYIRTDTTLEGFLKLVDVPISDKSNFKLVLAGHSALSLMFPQFGRNEVIATDLDMIYVDGMNVARGWPLMKDKLGLWENRLELRMPIAEQFLWSTLFFDAAVPWNRLSDIGATRGEDFLFSLGAGLRFTIPQFPIRLYFTQRFKIENGRIAWQQGSLPLLGMKLDFVISLGGDTF